jgi:hypothetical protein
LWIASFSASTQKSFDLVLGPMANKVSFQRVRDATGQNLPGKPVHDGDEIEEAATHGQVGDVGAPSLVGPFHPQPAEQIGVGLVPLRGSAGIGLLVDRHQSHEPHQPPDAFPVHDKPLVLQMSGHLADAVERSVQKLPVEQQHQVEVHRCLAMRRVVER